MAALVVDPAFDLGAFRGHLVERLPDYARPLFLRIVPGIELTGTFKLRKQDLAVQGYARTGADEVLYFDDRQQGSYVVMDESVYERIRDGKLRL